ncbi:oligosaccharide repeat unit polymerase [Microcystis aeruginosa BLCCF158]|uniref:Oligosaccharide repeat unit polymerase n=1 Tax=Microcystis aeruginosa BLCC-F158 TaxID=2755316 RepID=A0A841V049_MICAE|nr:O-antigen polymerase [Microcystis aeruginosa]MBC1193977.1 oligosaccharide repeat unit polymerase [Microcystis aeruginosa BLCC-F158]
MFFLILVTSISLWVSFVILNIVKKDQFLYFLMFLVYLAWHLPAILSIVLPFDYFAIKEQSFVIVLLFFCVIHLIQYAGALAYLKSIKYLKNRQIIKWDFSSYPVKSTQNSSVLLLYVVLGYIACIFSFIDKVSQGFLLSFDSIADNRAAVKEQLSEATAQTTVYSFISNFFSGFIYYLLFFSFENKNGIIKIKWIYIFPFLIYSVLIFILGHKSYILPGLIIIFIKYIYENKITFKKTIIYFLIISFITISIAVSQELLRVKSYDVISPQKLFSENIGLEINYNHPLAELIDNSPTIVYLPLAMLYLYYGVEYDMLYVNITSFDEPIIPLGAWTVPLLYRRYQSIFDLPDLKGIEDLRETIHGNIHKSYNVFPRVWGTMFLPLYLEGGFLLILIVVIITIYLNFYLVKKYVLNFPKNSVINLIIFNVILIYGVMVFPFSSTSLLTLVIAAGMLPYIRPLAKIFSAIIKG